MGTSANDMATVISAAITPIRGTFRTMSSRPARIPIKTTRTAVPPQPSPHSQSGKTPSGTIIWVMYSNTPRSPGASWRNRETTRGFDPTHCSQCSQPQQQFTKKGENRRRALHTPQLLQSNAGPRGTVASGGCGPCFAPSVTMSHCAMPSRPSRLSARGSRIGRQGLRLVESRP